MNTAFTCLGRGFNTPVRPVTAEEWLRARKEPWLKMQCEKIAQMVADGASDDDIKREKAKLWVWTPHCAGFRNNHRSVADAEHPLPRLMLDFDEKGHTADIMTQMVAKRASLTAAGIEVLLIEESVRRGTHVLVELPEGMSAADAQKLMEDITGFAPDAAVKDVSRCIYMVPDDYTRYVSERMYKTHPQTPPVREGSGLREAAGKSDVASLAGNSDIAPATERSESPLPDGRGKGVGLSYRGIPYTSIISVWWRRTGGEPVDGERNVRLHKLAANLRAICDNRKEVLMQVMPRFGLSEQELQSIVDSACKEPVKGISKLLEQCITEAANASDNDSTNNSDDTSDTQPNGQCSMVNVQLKKLPIGLKESLVGVPETMQMPVLCAVLPIAAAYADQVEVEYCDGQRQYLGLMSIIRGEQASGKSVCKNAVDVWKRQLEQEDLMARLREEEWKERKKSRKANEKAPDDPHVLIRMVPVTVSCSTLLKRLKNSRGHTLYSFGEELDTLRKTNGAGSWSSKYDIYRLSFDHGEWGQDYNSDAAESGVVKVAYNWTMLGTNGAMRKCFKQDNIENGLSSRILVAEMPDSSFARMPKFGRRSADDEARIQEAVTRLRSHTGFIDTPRLRKAIENWVEEKRLEAAKDIDQVKDVYRKRAAVIGFRCGVIHHLLQDSPTKEVHSSIKFALMMAEYALQQQIAAFGETLCNQYKEAGSSYQRNTKNKLIFDQLQPTFRFDDLQALRRDYSSGNALRMIISRWIKDNLIEKIGQDTWRKKLKTDDNK